MQCASPRPPTKQAARSAPRCEISASPALAAIMRRGGGGGGGGGTTMTTGGGTTRYVALNHRACVADGAPVAAAPPLPDQDAIGTMREDGFTPAATTTGAAKTADGISRASSSGIQSPIPSRSLPSSSSGGGMLRPAQPGSLEVDDADNDKPWEEEDSSKVRRWKNSRYAVGLVEVTWEDEVHNRGGKSDGRPRRNCCAELCREGVEPSCCCLSCLALSGMVCPLLGAKRLGNMVILKESVRLTVDSSDDEEDDTDEANDAENIDEADGESGMMVGTRKYRTNLDCVLGPYWPFQIFITYPLVYGLTLLTLVKAVPKKHPVVIGLWFAASLVMCVSLFKVSCTDPGIMRRRRRPPRGAADGARWRWNDSSLSYLPRSAAYDADCGCVVEEFDHVCPWTGTAIGKHNMGPFNAFMSTWFVCLVMDILLLTGVL